MAKSVSFSKGFISVIILFLTCLVCVINSYSEIPSKDVVLRWAEMLNARLIPQLDKISGIKNLDKHYSDLRKAKLVKLDGNSLVQKMSRDCTNNLEKKMDAVERLVAATEAAVKNYKFNASITVKDEDMQLSKRKMKDLDDSRLVYSEKFKRGVNYSYSGIHIPVEIYEGDTKILNGLKWSTSLTHTFKENLQSNPDLLWQHFGSHNGFMITYPAHKWIILPKKENFPDMYDVRLRPWYIHASSSPKDMLILMDRSGSMHGQTMGIMKIAVKTLLTTLGENDFVNIIEFSSKPKWISDCFDTLVQANRRNKQILSHAINNLTDGDMAKLSDALEFAFEAFLKFRNNRTKTWAGADCNQIIMIFSDGGTEEAWDALEKYNSDKKIRIFTFAVGPHPVPYATLKQIACKYRGYHSSITAMGDIRTKVQDYVKVLARPLVLSQEKQFEWNNFYLDAMGLGMMTTVTLPVFNRTDGGTKKGASHILASVNQGCVETEAKVWGVVKRERHSKHLCIHKANQSIAGVIGVDIALKELQDFEPSFEIGPGGYSFGLNQNGFIVFHQDLNTEFVMMDDPPHMDFLELEIENPGKDELRTEMINLESGKKSILSLLKMPDDKHIVRHRMDYFYTPLNKTSYSYKEMNYSNSFPCTCDQEGRSDLQNLRIAIVIPTDRTHNLVVDGMDFSEGLGIDADNSQGIFLAPWKYCHGIVLNLEMDDIIRNLSYTLMNIPEKCKSQLLQRLLWDVRKTDDTVHYWQTEQQDEHRDLVIATFVQTEGGLTRIYPPSEAAHLIDETNPSRSLIFQRAYYGEDYVFLPPKSTYGTCSNQTYESVTTIVKSISFSRGGVTYKPAVVGVMIDPMWLQPYLLTTPSGKVPFSCSDTDNIICYLVDDGGFIISSNQPDYMSVIGKFMGCTDSELMAELYERQIYLRNEEFDYEGRCEKARGTNAGLRTAHMPLYSILSSFHLSWVFDMAAWAQIKIWILSFLSSFFVPASDALPEFYELPNETTCTRHKAQYYLGRWGRTNNGEIRCKNCTRYYSLAKVGKMNLLLLVSSKPCAPLFCDPVPRLVQESTKYEKEETCERPIPYRKRPDNCFAYHDEEDYSVCFSTAAVALPHFPLVLGLVCFLMATGLLECSLHVFFFSSSHQ